MTRENMIKAYKAAGVAQGFILGFILNDELCVRRIVGKSIPDFCFKADVTAADESGLRYDSIRFRPTKREKLILNKIGAPLVVKGFNAKAKNLGNELERAIRETYGADTAKDNRKFTDAADVTIYGVGYEIKFDDATWTTEKELRSL